MSHTRAVMHPWPEPAPLPGGVRRRAPRFTTAAIRRHPLFLLAVLGSAAGRVAEEALAPCDIDSREFAVLELLVRAEGPMAQATIAFRLRRDRSTTMRLTRSLASKGLVSRTTEPEDGRVRALTLTPRGAKRFRLAENRLREAARGFMWLLSDEERTHFVRMLLRVL